MNDVDYDADWAFFPNVVKVTISSNDPDSGAVLASVSNVDALRRKVAGGDEPVGGLGGHVGTTRRRFHLRASQTLIDVKPRDVITDADNTTWEVTGATLVAQGSRWECETVRAG